jgi:methylase of polypeptide subunit release factors
VEDEARGALARTVVDALRSAGVPVLGLNGVAPEPELTPDAGMPDRRVQLLVPRKRFDDAVRLVEPMSWRYSWMRRGLVRLVPGAYYWFDGGVELELYWGVPAAPLPSAVLSGLSMALWQGAIKNSDGALIPDPAALLVYLSVRASAPGGGHERDWTRFRSQLAHAPDLANARDVARRAGVLPALDRALSMAKRADARRPDPHPRFRGWREASWRMALGVQRHARPRRLGRLLAPIPTLGDFGIRCRVLGVETIAERDVFVPTPDAELIASMASEIIASTDPGVVVDVGTGNGAIALALAATHPDVRVEATELLPRSASCAERNVERLGLRNARVRSGSLLDPLPAELLGGVGLVIANLPFYPQRNYAAVGSVPRATIEGEGDDGLGLIRRLIGQATDYLSLDGWLLLQMFAWQWEILGPELADLGFRLGTTEPTGPFVIAPAQRVDRRSERGRAEGHPRES